MFHSDIRSSDDEGNSMASLEMHHCILTIYDISCLICEHFLNLGHQITEFDFLYFAPFRDYKYCTLKTAHFQYHRNIDGTL